MATDFDAPSEQDLALNDFMIQAIRVGVEDPPEVLLILDVTHEETMHEWRTQIRIDRERFLALLHLMNHVAKTENMTGG